MITTSEWPDPRLAKLIQPPRVQVASDDRQTTLDALDPGSAEGSGEWASVSAIAQTA